MAGFRLRTEGETSLDGKLNLKMRLGLPPLGIIGIPLKVTGTQENPKIKMGKNKEELEETEYKDE
jgi:AsmA protein